MELDMLETLKTVVNSFDAPLKLTITSCWDEGICNKYSTIGIETFFNLVM